MDVVAVVVTYKRKELLSQVLDGLINQTHKISKILVVDNDSQDGTEELVSKFSEINKSIIYFNTGGNLGGAGGFYAGFKEAENYSYDYIWLMDDDLVPDENCLQNLLAHNPSGIIQPLRFNKDGSCAELSPVEYDLNKVFCTNPKRYTVAKIYNKGRNVDILPIAGVPFEGPLIKRDVVETIGFPNPKFFIFNDDLDYALRAKKANFDILCAFNSKATRLLVNNQSDDLRTWKGYFMLRNHFYILRTYGGNLFVRNRSLAIAFFYLIKSLFQLDFTTFLMVIRAWRDSFTLQNNEINKPK